MSDMGKHGARGFITVHSMGGLGNQLFIYAAGLSIARASGCRLRIDTTEHATKPQRPAALQGYGFPAEYVVRPPGRSPLQRMTRSRLASPPRGCTLRESEIHGSAPVGPQVDGSCLYGYWQHWQYPQAVAHDIRSHAGHLKQRRLSAYGRAVQRLREPGSIALHVRRGDYLAPAAHMHGLASPQYYSNAVALLRKLGHDGTVYLFSDDVDLAMRELSPVLAVRPLLEGATDELDEMLLMSEASALVTANSSFSWWAGWLGDQPGRPVIAPRPWFDAPSVNTHNLLPPHWLTLDRRAFAP